MDPPWYFDDLSISELQGQSLGEGIRVLLLDTGVTPVTGLFTTLSRLAPDGSPSAHGDQAGHGTACASIIASLDDEAPGLAPQVELIAMRVTAGSVPIESEVRQAFQTALTLGVHIISCSFTLADADGSTLDAIRAAADSGIAVVAAAGNSPDRASDFPERTPNVLVVGAYDRGHAPLRGRRGLFVDVLAPGEDLPVILANGSPGTFGDSSGAAAVVTGVIALVLSIARSKDLRRLGLLMEGLVRGTARSEAAARPIDPLRLLAAVQNLP